MVPRCFRDHPITTAFIVLLSAASGARLLTSGRALAPRLSDQGSLLFFLRESRLIQSFNVDSAELPPDVWQRRLGLKAAAQRWQSSKGHRWWMVWLQDGSPLLVLHRTKASEPSRVSSTFPDVELLFADELHRKSFFSKSPSRISTRSILEEDCIDRLTRSPAVAWNPSGLSAIAGPLAFALNSGSHGCLSLTLDGRQRLRLDGSVSSRPLSSPPKSLRRPPEIESGFQAFVDATPMNNRLALHWQGASTKPLFSSLLQRRLISDAIEKTYGLTPDFQAAWLGAPFDLKAQLRNDGPLRHQFSSALYSMLGMLKHFRRV